MAQCRSELIFHGIFKFGFSAQPHAPDSIRKATEDADTFRSLHIALLRPSILPNQADLSLEI